MSVSILFVCKPLCTTQLLLSYHTIVVFETLNGRLALEQGSYRPEAFPKHVSDHLQQLIFHHKTCFFKVRNPLDVILSGFEGLRQQRMSPRACSLIRSSVPLKLIKQMLGQD